MISKLLLRYGSADEPRILEVDPRPVTIFVGPNHSGKSLILREIESFCADGPDAGERCLLANLEIEMPPPELAVKDLERFRVADAPGQPGRYYLARQAHGGRLEHRLFSPGEFMNALRYGADPDVLTKAYAAYFTLRLDGATRLSLLRDSESDLRHLATATLMRLFEDTPARENLRKTLAEVFGEYFVIDPTGHRFRARFSTRPPSDDQEERSLSARAHAFHEAAIPIDDYSDGVLAFAGIVATVLSGSYRILLIDEPEAFLHPPLARRMGGVLSSVANDFRTTLFVATHSPQVVAGFVEAGLPVNVIRLSYSKGVSSAKLLPYRILEPFLKDPLLRSTNVLWGLFSSAVLICEGDTQRTFYEEINRRLVDDARPAIAGCTFVNGRTKKAIPQILGPMRDIGITAGVILDLDILRADETLWAAIINAARIPDARQPIVNTLRREVLNSSENGTVDFFQTGRATLEGAAIDAFDRLAEILGQHGLFLVPSGRVESWLTDLGIGDRHEEWLTSMLERLGSDPMDPQYVHPRDGDVWSFFSRIGSWFADPDRRGLAT